MKKLLIFISCLFLILSFAACDSRSEDNSPSNGEATESTVESGAGTGQSDSKETILVYFNVNGGVVEWGETTFEIEKNTGISDIMCPDVSRSGYKFYGWAYDENGSSLWSSGEVFFADTVLYAVWVKVGDSGTTDTSNPGTTDTSNPGTTDTSNPGTTDTSNPGTTDTSNPGTEDSGKPEKVIIVFRANGGVIDFTSVEIEKGSKLSYTKVPNVTRDGYSLKGWSFDVAGAELWSARSHVFDTDTVLYAIWEKDSTGTTDTSNPGTTDTSKPGTTDTSKPGTTDTSKPGTTDTSKPGTSGSSGGTTSSTRPPVPIVPDRTQYKPDVLGNKEGIYYANELVKHPILTPYYNGYKAALTMTFDDGYHAETGDNISDQFARFGYRGTMMLGVMFINSESMIKSWNDVFSRGYLDLGCHAYNHLAPSQLSPSEFEHEIKDAIMFLREKFPGQRVLTFATPLAQLTNAYEDYLKDLVIGNRLEAGGSTVNLGKNLDYNPYRVKAVSFNVRTNMSGLRTEVEAAVKNGSWLVELCHCVKENADGVDVELSVFQNHCEWLYRNYRDDLWVTTFEDVLVYGEQLRHTVVDYTACDRESMTFTVTPDGTLDKNLYKIPMTIMVYMPEFVDSAYATVNGEYQPLEIVSSSTGERIVYVRGISATDVSTVKVYLGANKTMKNNCVHSYSVAEIVEPTHENGGYTLNECSKCNHTYYSQYTNPVHDYTGREEVVIEPVLTQRGLKRVYCNHCDKYIVEEVRFEQEQ